LRVHLSDVQVRSDARAMGIGDAPSLAQAGVK
jgi:hypothetical protein